GIPRRPVRARSDGLRNTTRDRSAPRCRGVRPPGSGPSLEPGYVGRQFPASWDRLLLEARRVDGYPRSTNRSVPPESQRLQTPPRALTATATAASSIVQWTTAYKLNPAAAPIKPKTKARSAVPTRRIAPGRRQRHQIAAISKIASPTNPDSTH